MTTVLRSAKGLRMGDNISVEDKKAGELGMTAGEDVMDFRLANAISNVMNRLLIFGGHGLETEDGIGTTITGRVDDSAIINQMFNKPSFFDNIFL